MSTITSGLPATSLSPAAGAPRIRSSLGPIRRALLAYDVWRERRALAELDERALKDIGLSRSVAYREASRGLFDLPAGR